MTLKNGTGQACAACKYQRRRCTPECLLAPFFPADQPKMFQYVHRLFGVKNIQNLLKELSPEQKPMAMKSIKFHAAMRDKYPVYGCLVEIQQLTYQIQMAEEELQAILQQLAYYRQQQQQQQQQQHHQQEVSATTEYLSELQLGMAPPGPNTTMTLVQDESNNNNNNSNGNNNPAQYNNVADLPIGPGPQISSYSNSCNGDYGITYLDFKESNAVDSFCHETYSNNNSNENVINADAMVVQAQLVTSPQLMNVEQEAMAHDYNEMHPFFDNIDDTQSYIGCKDAYETSLGSPLKDSRSQLADEMDENELKSAAACFSLTSVN
ncbi:LOB domain-containing protein 27 [Striga hermonthica]|uniref:LOB domain-containing protein 27 n=1 Tax=Striga hermonthica TaxID=68872 RepID=A0A9N7N9Z6_STRHE|nr:LOB domain-containing protein 27 [Striga hermonthica]